MIACFSTILKKLLRRSLCKAPRTPHHEPLPPRHPVPIGTSRKTISKISPRFVWKHTNNLNQLPLPREISTTTEFLAKTGKWEASLTRWIPSVSLVTGLSRLVYNNYKFFIITVVAKMTKLIQYKKYKKIILFIHEIYIIYMKYKFSMYAPSSGCRSWENQLLHLRTMTIKP